MIYAKSKSEVEEKRKAFIRKWRLKCRAVADSLEEAGDKLFTFTRFPQNQWKSIRTSNAIERLHEEFKRRIKTQTVLPCAETAAMLFWAATGVRSEKRDSDPRKPNDFQFAHNASDRPSASMAYSSALTRLRPGGYAALLLANRQRREDSVSPFNACTCKNKFVGASLNGKKPHPVKVGCVVK